MFGLSSKYRIWKNSKKSKSNSKEKLPLENNIERRTLTLKRLDVDEDDKITSDAKVRKSFLQRISGIFRRKKTKVKCSKPAPSLDTVDSSKGNKLTFDALLSTMVATKTVSRRLKKKCSKIDISGIQNEIKDVLEEIEQKRKVLQHSYCPPDVSDEELEAELDEMMYDSESEVPKSSFKSSEDSVFNC